MKTPRVTLASNPGDGVQDVSLFPINSFKSRLDTPICGCLIKHASGVQQKVLAELLPQ